MTDPDAPVRFVAETKARDRRNGILQIALALMIGLLMGTSFIAYDQWQESQDNEAALAVALEAQREQFDYCGEPANASTTYCQEPISDSPEEVVEGPPGVPGQPGPAGPPGTVGATGAAGQMGRPGQDGVDGRPGRPGIPGQDGSSGPAGVAGSNGSDGSDGQDGATGPRGASCVEEIGLEQCRGPQGADGQQGPEGAQGPPGPVCQEGTHPETRTVITAEHPLGEPSYLCVPD